MKKWITQRKYYSQDMKPIMIDKMAYINARIRTPYSRINMSIKTDQ